MRHYTARKLFLAGLIILLGLVLYLYLRPIPAIEPVAEVLAPVKTSPVAMPWPAVGQAAIGANGYGVLETHNTGAQVSIASIAKIITALAVLRQKPLAIGSQGPTITLDSQDLDYFNYYYLNDGSAAKVAVGEQISEYQALEGMLLPSANNLADSLGRWAFGSGTAYTAYANKMLKSMGLAQTTAGGPSGFADDTTSTAGDLVKIGLQAMANPIIAQIVEQPSATIPTAGEVKNLNWLLGSDGINGVKTGNTDKAGGCYLFAANRQVQGRSVLVIGAILGASDLNNAITAAKPLLAAADSGFVLTTPVHKGQVVGTYKTPWEGSAQALATKDLSVLAWKDKDIQISDKPQPVSTPAEAGAPVGSISLQNVGLATSSSLVLSQELSGPSWRWRIFHK